MALHAFVEMRMKYSVIGASNTLVRDNFIDQMREKFPQHEQVSLGRVGASTSVILPFFATDPAFFSGSQFCVVDVCVIDSGGYAKGVYDLATAEAMLRWFGHVSRAAGCEPIFLIIHTTHHLQAPRPRTSYFEMVHRVVAEENFLHIDVGKLVAAAAKASGLSPTNACYDDPWHLNEETHCDIANMLGWFFDHGESSADAVRASATIANLRKVSPSEQPGAFERREHRSSTVSFDGVFIPQWGKYELKIGSGRVFAAMVNVSSTHCLARIRGAGEILVDLDILPYSVRLLEARVIHVAKTLIAKDGKIEIMPCPVEAPKRAAPLPPPGLEIGDVVIWDGDSRVNYDHHPIKGDNDLFRRFFAAGGALADRSAEGHKHFARSVRDYARRSGVSAELVGDDQFGVCRVRPLSDQRIELPAPDGSFTAKIIARKAQESACNGVEVRFADGERFSFRLSDDLRTAAFTGRGGFITMTSIPPGHPFVVEKVVLKPTG